MNDILIKIGENLDIWLKNNSNIESYSEQYRINKNSSSERNGFQDNIGVSIYTDNRIVSDVSVFPYIPNDSRYYKKDVFIFGELLPKPFLSDDIEKYFQGIKIKKPHTYWGRFSAHDFVYYPISEKSGISIMMDRSPQYVGGLSYVEEPGYLVEE